MGMRLKSSDLLPGERKLFTKGANLVVSINEAGLSRFIASKYLWLTGMEGKEAIGGLAHLTNYRLIFKSHFLNRLRGSHSIFLPNVASVKTGFNRLYVETEIQRFAFVMWFKTDFANAVLRQRDALGQDGTAKLQELVTQNSETIGPGLQKWTTLETLNRIASAGLRVEDVVKDIDGAAKFAYLEFLSLMKK
jgi:hypothetical protein